MDELVNIVHETGAGDVEWDDGEEEAVTASGMRLHRLDGLANGGGYR